MITLVWAFWFQDPSMMRSAGMHKRKVGPYVVRTWCDPTGKPICTGWFTPESKEEESWL